jgi:hypothetical protein
MSNRMMMIYFKEFKKKSKSIPVGKASTWMRTVRQASFSKPVENTS